MIGFIGGGNMAEALIKGILQSGTRDIMVSEPRGERREYLDKTYGIQTTPDNRDVCINCTIIILAVKPQNMDEVTAELSALISQDTFIISIAAGITLSVSLFEAEDFENHTRNAEYSCSCPGGNVCDVYVRMYS